MPRPKTETPVVEQPKTETPVVEQVFGMDKTEYDKLPYREQMRIQSLDKTSDLANQVTPELTVTFQLLNNTPVQLIEAMTGKGLDFIKAEAEKLNVTVKTTQAGDLMK